MKVFRTITDISLIILTILSGIICIAFGFYSYFVHETTIGVNYASEQVPIDLVEKKEELTEEQIKYYENRILFEAQYFSNDKNNGIELQEIKLDYFTDTSLTISACRSTGMQFIGDFENYDTRVWSEKDANNRVSDSFTYYDTTNMITWNGGNVATQLNRNAKLIIKIDDKPFLMQLTGEYSEGWWIFKRHYYFEYQDVFYDIMKAIKTNNKGYGDYYITLNLSQYFSFYEYDETSKRFIEDTQTDILTNYAVLKFHYNENGAVKANQSMFGIIGNDPLYGMTDKEIDTTYWLGEYVYNFTPKNLELRHSEALNGNVVSLSRNDINQLNECNNYKLNITIDLTKSNIVGLDYNAFEGIKIESLTILGSGEFHILEKALYNTELEFIKHNSDVTIKTYTNSINSNYEEVIV